MDTCILSEEVRHGSNSPLALTTALPMVYSELPSVHGLAGGACVCCKSVVSLETHLLVSIPLLFLLHFPFPLSYFL